MFKKKRQERDRRSHDHTTKWFARNCNRGDMSDYQRIEKLLRKYERR